MQSSISGIDDPTYDLGEVLTYMWQAMDADETMALELMEQEENALSDLIAAEEKGDSVAEEFDREQQRLETQINDKSQKLASRSTERDKWLMRIEDNNTRQRVENLRMQHGCHYLVDIIAGCCGGCRMAQTQQIQLEARLQRIIVLCEGCGRILVGNQDPIPQPVDPE